MNIIHSARPRARGSSMRVDETREHARENRAMGIQTCAANDDKQSGEHMYRKVYLEHLGVSKNPSFTCDFLQNQNPTSSKEPSI